jgi:uncharacterized protein
MPYLSQIWIYPIKSFDGVAVQNATLLPGGALKGDRQFALIDAQDRFVNAKRTAAIQRLRTSFTGSEPGAVDQVTLQLDGEIQTFELREGKSPFTDWLSDYFGYAVSLQQDRHMGFPDDRIASGPTLVSVKTLEAVATWFDLTLEETRRRFRTNLELEEAIAFWEDTLLAPAGELYAFHLGEVTLLGSNVCSRCIVPTRDSRTGDRTPAGFQTTFTQQRQLSLADSLAEDERRRSRFDHFYRLTLNTKVPESEAGKKIALGDAIKIPF